MLDQHAAFGRIVDMHTHVFDSLPQPDARVLERMQRLARDCGIAQTVLLANGTGILADMKANEALIRDINTYTLKAMAHRPERIIGFCYLNPAHSQRFLHEELERCITRGGMRGVKLEAAVNARDRRMDPLMEMVEALGVPIVHHSWYKATPHGRNESNPSDIADLGRRFPQVQLIMAHLGGARQRGILDIHDLANVAVDTSGSQPEEGLVEYAVRRLGAERVVYGSDWPIRDYAVQLGRILAAEISDRQKEMILCGNARRLIGLGEDGGSCSS